MAVGRELNALLIAEKDDTSGLTVGVRNGSPRSGVVRVGDDGADVVMEAVVIPIKVVVTTVSISGDESAVNVV